MKWYLIIGGIFLICALGAVIYVWALYQDMHRTFDAYVPNAPQVEKTDTEGASVSADTTTESVTDTEEAEPIVVDTTTLGTTQQEMLKAFGYDSQTLTITPTMVSCAENAVGKERLDAITRGGAPTPFEAAKILPCFKKD